MTELHNPMWDVMLPHLVYDNGFFECGFKVPIIPLKDDGTHYGRGEWDSDEYKKQLIENAAIHGQRWDRVKEFAWTITAPHTVDFVSEHSTRHIHDPLAGTGYWAYLLRQKGHKVTAADIAPGNNHWASKLWCDDIQTRDARASSYQAGPNATLLLAWPPYESPIGYQAVRAFRGDRIIYIGEGCGGCCGNYAMFDELERSWREVDWHKPPQWEGIRDYVTVYKRVRRFGRK